MKKKWTSKMALALTAAMLTASLAACGSTDDGGSSSTPSSSAEESSVVENTESSEEVVENTNPLNNPLFEGYDFGGITLTVLKHSDFTQLDPDAEGLEAYQVEERQAQMDYIEEKYNVNLEFVDVPTDDWDSIPTEIVSAYASGNPVADIMNVYFQFVGTYVANDILYDFTEDFANSDEFSEDYKFVWLNKNWGLSTGMGGEGIYYNMDWINEMGMEYTPAEMFDMGQWSYDDCYDYLLEMKSHMAEDEYPLFVAPYYWMLFATAANGEIILDPSGNLNYTSDAFIESLEFFERCLNDGLIARADQNEEGGYNTWGYPGNTFDQGVTVAMAHRAAWQAAGLVDKFTLGFVPYPWGSEVSVGSTGNSGDYLSLSDNYASSYYDGQLIAVTKGVEQKADPVEVLKMVLDWRANWNAAMTAYVDENAGDQSSCGWLEDGIDKDLYFYSLSRERLEPFNSLDIDTTIAPNGTMYGGASIRSAMASFYNADMALMIDAGYAPEEVFVPEEVEEDTAE